MAKHRKTIMSPILHGALCADPLTVAFSEDFDVRYWTKQFDVNEDQLRAVVLAVGTSVTSVRARLLLCGA